jgi:hypothetical protein
VKQHLRIDLPPALLVPNPENPNKMSGREFDLLVDNMQRAGFTDAALVWPGAKLEEFMSVWASMQEIYEVEPEQFYSMLAESKITFMVIGGHHRIEAAKFLDLPLVPCTVVIEETFDKEQADMQLLRHNTIHGSLDPERFIVLYDKYKNQYPDDVIQDMFGFSDEKAFRKLIDETAAALPDEMKKKFNDAKDEIKTIDDLSKVLNHLFSTYGDTLDQGYMILDQAGVKSLWLRMSKKTMDAAVVIGESCRLHDVTMDDMFGRMVQLIASGEAPDLVERVVSELPKAGIPKGLEVLPTADNLEKIESVKTDGKKTGKGSKSKAA